MRDFGCNVSVRLCPCIIHSSIKCACTADLWRAPLPFPRLSAHLFFPLPAPNVRPKAGIMTYMYSFGLNRFDFSTGSSTIPTLALPSRLPITSEGTTISLLEYVSHTLFLGGSKAQGVRGSLTLNPPEMEPYARLGTRSVWVGGYAGFGRDPIPVARAVA